MQDSYKSASISPFCFPDHGRNRQVLVISFHMVSEFFFQATPSPLQVCPASSSRQVSYKVFSLSADMLSSDSSMHSLRNSLHVPYLYTSYIETSEDVWFISSPTLQLTALGSYFSCLHEES